MRALGDNSLGFVNESEIRDALNSKKYDDINPNLRHMLDDMFKGYNLKGKWVHAHKFSQRMKPDFYVTVDGVPFGKYVSVKMGSGNSIHQESLSSFVNFLKNVGVNDNDITLLKEYHYSDGTSDNTGEIRYGSKEYTKMHPEIIERLNKVFNNRAVLEKAVTRMILIGNYPDAPETDYLYHGTARNGVWASKQEILDYIYHLEPKKNCVAFGPLTYQAWNKNLKFDEKSEHKRLQMQVKWGTLLEAILEITSRRDEYKQSGTYQGDMSEKASVISFNRNPNSQIFQEYLKKINKNPENVLLIRVTTKQISKISKQKVNTRADAYAIEVVDEKLWDLLEENNYYLDENILDGYDEYYRCIEKSGISIKKDDSENYTLIKMTPNSFNELFGCYELGYGASVFCKKSSELYMNIPLMSGWKTSIEDIQMYFNSTDINEVTLVNSLEICKKLKEFSVNRIKNIIDNSVRLQSIIFNGIDVYDEPYSAYFFMQNNMVRVLGYMPYNVTTGSGRSHGDYSLILKPKN